MTVRSGEFVAQFIDDGDVSDDKIQPNGVDLSIGKIERIRGIPLVKDGEYDKGIREEIPPNDNGLVNINLGGFVVTYDEKIEIPPDCVGYVFPRSRLPRCGLFLTTAMWDAGYEGKGEGMLMSMTKLKIEHDMNVAQIAFLDADEADKTYDGSHQHENL